MKSKELFENLLKLNFSVFPEKNSNLTTEIENFVNWLQEMFDERGYVESNTLYLTIIENYRELSNFDNRFSSFNEISIPEPYSDEYTNDYLIHLYFQKMTSVFFLFNNKIEIVTDVDFVIESLKSFENGLQVQTIREIDEFLTCLFKNSNQEIASFFAKMHYTSFYYNFKCLS